MEVSKLEYEGIVGGIVMKNCPTCNAQLNDDVIFCPNCGTNFNAGPVPNQQQPNMQQPNMQQPVYNQYDHTSEFDPADISDGKVFAMLPYLLSILGVIVAVLCRKDNPYVDFHVKEALKLTVVETFLLVVAGVLAFTFIVPILAGICVMIVVVLQIIAFFQVCGGKAKEAGIIRSFKMFK